jgi:transketolase
MGGQAPLVAAQPGRRTGDAREHMTAAGQRPAQRRGGRGYPCASIDLYWVKLLDVAALSDAAAAASGRLVVARTVIPRAAPALPSWRRQVGWYSRCESQQCAVGGLPSSGTPAGLMDAAGASAPHISAAARTMLAS